MKRLGILLTIILLLALAGCTGVMEGRGTISPQRDVYPSDNWGDDAVCSPGCPPGMSGSW